MVRINIDSDDNLVRQGLKATKLKTKKELVHYALKELVRVDPHIRRTKIF